jgi:hypothetical protein
MVGWYDKFPVQLTDSFVAIDKTTGIATELPAWRPWRRS